MNFFISKPDIDGHFQFVFVSKRLAKFMLGRGRKHWVRFYIPVAPGMYYDEHKRFRVVAIAPYKVNATILTVKD